MTISNLTTVVVAHQANPLLQSCLTSLTPSKEILVVWNGPAEITKKIQLPPQAKLIHQPKPITDFAATRNEALKQVTTEWCLMIDSDEVVPAENWAVWQQEIDTTNANGLYLKRLDHFMGRDLQWGELKNQWHPRLFKTKETVFERPVHEVAIINGITTRSAGHILHFPHSTVSEFITDTNTYTLLEAKHRHSQGKTWSWWETITYPLGKFLYNLLWNQAWRDGFPGIIYTFIMSAHSFWVRVYLYELNHIKSR